MLDTSYRDWQLEIKEGISMLICECGFTYEVHTTNANYAFARALDKHPECKLYEGIECDWCGAREPHVSRKDWYSNHRGMYCGFWCADADRAMSED